MPVTKSAKRAQRISIRRAQENVITRATYKKALKTARKAIEGGVDTAAELLSKAQSALDTAAKSKGIHPNKAARLKSRLAKKAAGGAVVTAPKKQSAAKKKAAPKKKAAKK
jgi:small subunit ribosomal protein S20